MNKKFVWTSLVAFALAASFGQAVKAQTNPAFNVTQYRAAFAVEKVTVSSVTKTLTSATYAPTANCTTATSCNADYALITVEAASSNCMRYWPDGTAPDASTGHKICDGGSFYIFGYKNIQNLKMIRVTTDVTIQVSYYRFSTNAMR